MNQLISQEIKEIVATGERLVTEASVSPTNLGPDKVQELASIIVRGGQIIELLYGSDSHYSQEFRKALDTAYFYEIHSNYYIHISSVVGIFKGVAHDIESGMLFDFRSLIRAEIFADFLGMAEHLLEEDYKDASAVLLGAILEDSLRKIADAKRVETLNSKGRPLRLDALNVSLAKKKVYSPLIQKQITSWANLRNSAAHGCFDEYDKEQVKQMLLFVQKFCADFLT